MKKGFTLIELLIVIAIIAILALIAVPNFLEAQVRAKVSRCMADIKSLETAYKAMYFDKGVMLVDYWDDDLGAAFLQERSRQLGLSVPIRHQDRGGTSGFWVPLTTPQAYITSIPLDPFADNGVAYGSLIATDTLPPYAYMYHDDEPSYNDARGFGPPVAPGDYFIWGAGPDKKLFGRSDDLQNWVSYNATNGTVSNGDVHFHSRTQFEQYKWQ